MKKITITTTAKMSGHQDPDGSEQITHDYYVSDGYDVDRCLEDAGFAGFYSTGEDGEANYTSELVDAFQFLDATSGELESMWSNLEVHATLVSGDTTLGEDDRDGVSSAIEDAVRALSGLQEECQEAMCCVDAALDAFKRLPMSE